MNYPACKQQHLIYIFKRVFQAIWGHKYYYFVIFSGVLWLKYFYSNASADDLMWILHPTAASVKWVSGLNFVFEAGTGFINPGQGVVIAPACSGVNFLIISICMVSFSFLHRFSAYYTKIAWMFAGIGFSFLMTVGVNTVRIIVAIHLYQHQIAWWIMTPPRIHRAEGILIYFLGLHVSYLLLDKITGALKTRTGYSALIHSVESRLSKNRFFFAIPFLWYAAVMILIPLMNPANHLIRPLFLENCLFLILGSISNIIFWIGCRRLIFFINK